MEESYPLFSLGIAELGTQWKRLLKLLVSLPPPPSSTFLCAIPSPRGLVSLLTKTTETLCTNLEDWRKGFGEAAASPSKTTWAWTVGTWDHAWGAFKTLAFWRRRDSKFTANTIQSRFAFKFSIASVFKFEYLFQFICRSSFKNKCILSVLKLLV